MSIEMEKREKINKKLKFLDNKINFVNLQTVQCTHIQRVILY